MTITEILTAAVITIVVISLLILVANYIFNDREDNWDK